MRRVAILLAAAVPLSGCGGAATEPKRDQALVAALESGADAMELGQGGAAARNYATAYRLAIRDDDAGGIATAGTGEVIAFGATGRAETALEAASRTRVDLARRFTPAPALLDLAEAAALLQAGRPADAARVAAPAERSSDGATALRAVFLEGVAADALGDGRTLAAAGARLDAAATRTESDVARADREELAARLALRDGDSGTALDAARRAADLRRTSLDDRGMRRALLIASTAAFRAGNAVLAAELGDDARASARAERNGG